MLSHFMEEKTEAHSFSQPIFKAHSAGTMGGAGKRGEQDRQGP